MKQILLLLLLFLPFLAMAQYTGNANQKITLGEQTTADGLVYRGVASSDTTRKPSIDTMAFILLDTTTNILWQYKKATNNAWTRLGGSISSGVTGVLPVANGGTGADMSSLPNNFLIRKNSTGIFDTAAIFEANGNVGIGTTDLNNRFIIKGNAVAGQFPFILLLLNGFNNNASALVPTETFLRLQYNSGGTGGAVFRGLSSSSTNGALSVGLTGNTSVATGPVTVAPINLSGQRITANNDAAMNDDDLMITFSNYYETYAPTKQINIMGNGFMGLGAIPTEKLHVVGNARITAVGAGAYANDLNITSTGVLTTASSDEKYKYNILPINYGLSTILQLKPVNFQWIKGEENDLGFIAQDVADIIPEAVDTNWNSDLLMRYESIIPILTKAIQEQQALIKALEQRILILENK